MSPSTFTSLTASSLTTPSTVDAMVASFTNLLTKGKWSSPSSGDGVSVWLGEPDKDSYGSGSPVIKGSGDVPNLKPVEVARLLMDSSRVQTYNSISLGRTDVTVTSDGLSSSNPKQQAVGTTKIVENVTAPPVGGKCTFRTMMHSRLIAPSSYVVVSRGLPLASQKSTILLGINIITPNGDGSLVESVTHVYSKGVPGVVARGVGVKGARDFVKSLRGVKVSENE